MDALADLGDSVRWYYASFSALDKYFGQSPQPVMHIAVAGDVVDLAKAVPHLEFPGVPFADAAAWNGRTRIYFRCIDDAHAPEKQPFRVQNLLYDPERDRYLDPYDDYRCLRAAVLEASDAHFDSLRRLMDAAIAVSRYPHAIGDGMLERVSHFPALSPEAQRALLTGVLTGASPWKGMHLLRESGFVAAYWPELVGMYGTEHSKEHHPEGDVWAHSLETFRYRRSRDLALTLALLLHDCGKPEATPVAGRRFDGHAEIGAGLAVRLLRRLEFNDAMVEDVRWLVSRHMFPGALHALPSFRTERLMSDALFPVLLELYRCDLESTYRGPNAYYRACRIYRSYLKNSTNPYRDSEGKKLVRLYVD